MTFDQLRVQVGARDRDRDWTEQKRPILQRFTGLPAISPQKLLGIGFSEKTRVDLDELGFTHVFEAEVTEGSVRYIGLLKVYDDGTNEIQDGRILLRERE